MHFSAATARRAIFAHAPWIFLASCLLVGSAALLSACSGNPALDAPVGGDDSGSAADAGTEIDASVEPDSGNAQCECRFDTLNVGIQTLACTQSKCFGGRTYFCSTGGQPSRGAACDIPDAGADSAAVDGGVACVSPDDATQVFTSLGLGRASKVAIDGNDVYFLWTPLPTGNVAIYKSTLAGAAPTLVKTLATRDAFDHGLAVQQGVVYYTDQRDALIRKVNTLFKIVTPGAAPTIVESYPVSSGPTDVVIGAAIETTASRLYAAFDKGGATPAAGVLRVTIPGGSAMPLAVTQQPALTYSVIAVDKTGYLAVYQESLVAGGADRKIRVFDPAADFAQIAVTPAATRVGRFNQHKMAVHGSTLAWFDDSGRNEILTACTLPNCVPAPVSFSNNVRLFTLASANGRLYFEYAVADKCRVLNVALASCAWDTVANGTCTPQIHATSFELLGAKDMAVGATAAIITSQNGESFRVGL